MIFMNKLNVFKGLSQGILLFLFIFSSLAFMKNDYRLVYSSRLLKLKVASAPEKIQLVDLDNSVKGKPLVGKGTLFTYKNRNAKTVFICGNFTGWQTKKMRRSRDGVWFFFLPLGEHGETLEYKYSVDGFWTPDPENPHERDDMNGSYLSLSKEESNENYAHISFRKISRDMVEFRIYKPSAKIISLVGDFNNWNPEEDLMKRDKNGVWRLKKNLLPGKYRYRYIIDGKWTVDLYNPNSSSDNTGELCSVITLR